MTDEKRPKFITWKAKIWCTEDLRLEDVLRCETGLMKGTIDISAKATESLFSAISDCQLTQASTTFLSVPILYWVLRWRN